MAKSKIKIIVPSHYRLRKDDIIEPYSPLRDFVPPNYYVATEEPDQSLLTAGEPAFWFNPTTMQVSRIEWMASDPATSSGHQWVADETIGRFILDANENVIAKVVSASKSGTGNKAEVSDQPKASFDEAINLARTYASKKR